MDGTLSAALDYAKRRWPVFPCLPESKNPATAHGFHDASVDMDAVRAWWDSIPDANVAVATGGEVGFVVDIDGEIGARNWRRITEEHGWSAETVAARTGSGGVHLFFLSEKVVRNRTNILKRLPGIELSHKGSTCVDIRGEGGYIIAPPSRHPSGGRYEWLRGPDELTIARAPRWLEDLVVPAAKAPARLVVANRPDLKADDLEEALSYIDAHDYDLWVQVGMALHTFDQLEGGGGRGRALWGWWSAQASNFSGEKDLDRRWAGFKAGGGITKGTIFELARMEGWERPGRTNANVASVPTRVSIPDEDGVTIRLAKDVPPMVVTPADEEAGEGPVEIRITTDIGGVVNEAEAALIKANIGLYQRGGLLVVVVESALGKLGRKPSISQVGRARLREMMATSARWLKFHPKSGEWFETYPPYWAVDTLLERGKWFFPRLRALSECPTMRRDGSVVESSGYDPKGQIYVAGGEWETLGGVASRACAEAGLMVLREVLCDFPFRAPHHESAAIAAIVTAVVRPGIAGPAPLFLVSSSTPGTGKSLIGDVVALIATGRGVARLAQGENDAEERKRITALAIESPAVLCIDNINRPLGSAALDAAITSDELAPWQDRILGSSRTVCAPIVSTWIATGNNVVVKGDLARRTLPIMLEAGVERPEERSDFRHADLRGWILSERSTICRAALTVVYAYVQAGRPDVDIPRMGTFERWSDLVRSAIVWLGCVDPNAGREEMREVDLEIQAWGQILTSIKDAFGPAPWTVGELADYADVPDKSPNRSALCDALEEIGVIKAGRINKRRLGWFLAKYKNRRVESMRVLRGERKTRGFSWTLVADT